MSEITIPLVFFIILCFSCCGVIVSYICERIDKTLKKKIELLKEELANELSKQKKLKRKIK